MSDLEIAASAFSSLTLPGSDSSLIVSQRLALQVQLRMSESRRAPKASSPNG